MPSFEPTVGFFVGEHFVRWLLLPSLHFEMEEAVKVVVRVRPLSSAERGARAQRSVACVDAQTVTHKPGALRGRHSASADSPVERETRALVFVFARARGDSEVVEKTPRK